MTYRVMNLVRRINSKCSIKFPEVEPSPLIKRSTEPVIVISTREPSVAKGSR
jgi:hypothetical protein